MNFTITVSKCYVTEQKTMVCRDVAKFRHAI